MQNTKAKILKALFAEAKRLGISQETLRDDIAPGVISKRLSAATSGEVAKVLVYIHNRHGVPENPKPQTANRKRYESSRAGLLDEIRDLAVARFGEDYALPLNAFCARFGETDGFRKMRINQMKMVKQRLQELQCRDTTPRVLPGSTETRGITFQKGRKGFLNQLGEMDRLGGTYGDY